MVGSKNRGGNQQNKTERKTDRFSGRQEELCLSLSSSSEICGAWNGGNFLLEMLEQLFKTFSFKSNCLRPFVALDYLDFIIPHDKV